MNPEAVVDHVDGTRLTISWWSTRSWSLEAARYGNILLMVTSRAADAEGGAGDMEMGSLGFCARPTHQYRAHFLPSVRHYPTTCKYVSPEHVIKLLSAKSEIYAQPPAADACTHNISLEHRARRHPSMRHHAEVWTGLYRSS